MSDFSFYSQLFVALANYRKTQASLSQQERVPLIRAMFL